MDHYELGVAMAVAHLAELPRQADRRRVARRIVGLTAGRRRDQAPASPWVLGRHRQAVDGAGGGRAAQTVVASGRGRAAEEGAMVVGHQHKPGVFDAGHCRGCAHQAGLLDHYWQVQQEEAALRQAHGWARAARGRASLALWSSGVAILLAAVVLLT